MNFKIKEDNATSKDKIYLVKVYMTKVKAKKEGGWDYLIDYKLMEKRTFLTEEQALKFKESRTGHSLRCHMTSDIEVYELKEIIKGERVTELPKQEEG